MRIRMWTAWLLLAVALLACPPAQADHEKGIQKVHPVSVPYGGAAISATNTMHVSGTALYTDVLSLIDSEYQSAAWTIDTSTTVALPVELQWSDDGTNFQSFRTAETWTVVGDETKALFIMSTPMAPYVRFKFGSEPSSHVCTITYLKLFRY